jgi:hypothetical protein
VQGPQAGKTAYTTRYQQTSQIAHSVEKIALRGRVFQWTVSSGLFQGNKAMRPQKKFMSLRQRAQAQMSFLI